MAVSLVLLGLLTGSWLDAQYRAQKEQLQKDLQTELAAAQKEVADSMLYINIVKPIMKVAKETNGSREIRIKKSGPSASFNVTMSTDGAPEDLKKIEKLFGANPVTRNAKKIIIDTRSDSTKVERSLSVRQPSEELLKDGMALIMKEVYREVGLSEDSLLRFDTTKLRTTFTKKLHDNKWPFAATWNEHVDDPTYNVKKAIVLRTEYMSEAYKVAIDGYKPYLFGKIAPQFLFSLMLLILVGAAFTISFRSLKEQMKLSTIKNDFISNMSHELKTPISTVKVALEALTTFNVVENPETTREYLKMASLEMNRLDMLVNQTLNTALLEEGKIALQKECVDIKKLVEDIHTMLQLRLKQADATLSIQSSNTDLSTQVDKLHIQGVIINLVDNSLKYADKLSVIEILLLTDANNVSITVNDNGPGIPKEHLAHVFDKFFRVPHGDRHNVKGYGLGLSYAKQIANLHGGTLTVRNIETGGCSFTLTIPKTAC
jgi:signal transduction histidine kinase